MCQEHEEVPQYQLKESGSGLPISTISRQQKARCRCKYQNRFLVENTGKLLAMGGPRSGWA
jgi:hypothetical protein